MDELRPFAAHSIDPDRYRSAMERPAPRAIAAPCSCQVQSVGTGRERRFAGLAELFEFPVADATSRSEGADGNAEASDTA